MGAQQIHSYSYSQILLSLSLTQTDLQFQTSCCHVKQIFVPNAELCRKEKAGCYCSNRKCWVASDDANKHLNLFFLLLTVKSKTYQLQLFLLRYLASTVRSGAGLEVGTHVLLPRPPSHLQQARFVVGDLGIK